MKRQTYSKFLMAPLVMLLAVACSPNQFNQSTEYDDVYFTSSDRASAPVRTERNRAAQLQTQTETANLENYSSENVNEKIVTKYNNGSDPVVTYFEEGPIVKRAQDLNYDDFVADYNNQQLAHYELPLDWETDWNRTSFNSVMQRDFHFRLAWYDQYYRGQGLRMNQYLTGSFAGVGRRGILGGPTIGLAVGFNQVQFGFTNMAFVDINPWGFYDPFWQPIAFRRNFWGWNRGWNRWGGWGWNSWGWNDPFFCPPVGSFAWGGWGWRNSWRNNVFVNNTIIVDRRADRILAGNSVRDVRRGPRVSTSRVSTVRNEAINGTAPTTRSSRYVDNLEGTRSANVRSRSGRANTGRATSTNSVVSRSGRSSISNGRNNRVRTSAYRFEDNGRSGRSNSVRNYGSSGRSSSNSQTRAITSRSGSRSSYGTARSSRSQSNPSFNRNSSSRSSYSSGRTSRSNDSFSRGGSSRNAYTRGSYSNGRSSGNSRSSYSRGSSSRSSYSRGSSRSSGSRSSYSRGSSSRSSGSISRGSSSRGSSRSSGSISRGSSSRSSGSRSSSSRSSSSRSGSSRSGRGN